MNHLPGLHEVPPAPRAPSPEARHLIFGYRGRQGGMLIAGMAFLVVGLIISSVTCWGIPVDVAIALGPREAPGTILEAELNPKVKINGSRPTKVRFEYRVGGAWHQGEANSFGVRSGQTGPIPVEYAALNPGWARVKGGTRAPFGYLGLICLLFPMAGVLMVHNAVSSNRKEIRAFTHGHPILARVIFRGQDQTTVINGRHPFLMRWEFNTETGAFQGSLSSMRLLDIKAFGDAEQVVVVYDPDDPRINTLFVP